MQNRHIAQPDIAIENLVIDSRSIINPDNAFFCALSAQRDGHEFIKDAYFFGIRNFLISDEKYIARYPGANFILVADVRLALQTLARVQTPAF